MTFGREIDAREAVNTDAGSAGGGKRCDLSGSLVLTAIIVP